MRPLNIALIGCGDRGRAHAKHLVASERINLIAVCDLIKERAVNYAEEFGVEHIFTKSSELLKMDELEAVVVVTQTPEHAPLAIEALAAGKHVLSEKPMADSLKEADQMVKAAEQQGLIGVIGFQTRFSPYRWALKQAANELDAVQVMYNGQRGLFMQKYLRPGSAYGVMDCAAHDIDFLNWLIGLTPKKVFASLRQNTFSPTLAIDVVSLQIEYDGKDDQRMASIIRSMGAPGAPTFSQVIGKKGYTQPEGEDSVKVTKVWFDENAGVEKERQVSSSKVYQCNKLFDEPVANPAIFAMHQNFAALVRGKVSEEESGLSTFSQGLYSQLVAEAVVESHKRGQQIDLATLKEELLKQ